MKAWLVTWEWTGEHARVKNPIAMILSSRVSGKRVREMVEQIYVNATYILSERAAYAEKKFNPYPAYYGDIESIDYLDVIYCGHNPYLHARRVDDLRVEIDRNGKESMSWKERPKPKAQSG